MTRPWIARLWEAVRRPWRRRPAVVQRRLTISYRHHDGTVRVGRIYGTVGMYLQIAGSTPQGMDQRLISEYDAADADEFWGQWRAWGGERIFFDDGTPYR